MTIIRSLSTLKPTTVALIVVVGYAFLYGMNLEKYRDGEIIQHDVISYYAYLPAVFIYHDLSFGFLPELPENSEVTIWTHTSPSGKPALKMTMGMALMQAPFFLLAHLLSGPLGFDGNGYSEIYQFFIFLTAVFYLFTGLYFLRRILRRYFSEIITAIVLAIMVLATNLFYYTAVEPGMPHTYGFALFAVGLWLILCWFEQPGWKYTIWLGLVGGLILLVRPSNVVVFVIPFIYGMKKIRFHHWKYIMTVLVIIFIVVIPQLYYWKFISGKWIYFAYGDERFYFSDPKILKGLFSYRKGWLVYSPIMLLALGGFFFMKGKLREIRFPLIIFILLNWYMVFSWWCWWYGGGFGARALIESYVILALPMGAALDRIWAARRWFKYGAFAIMVFLVYLNLFQVRQYRTTLLHWDSTSRELYWKVFLSHEWPENYHALLDPPDYEKAKFREE